MCADAAGEVGRGDVAFHHKMQPWVGLADTKEEARAYVASSMESFYGVPFEAFEKYTPYGTAADVAEGLAPYVEVGVSGFNVSLCGPDPDTVIELCGEVKRLLM
jgi:alkanesulfonate monooxygenase SsuD/methylene tetrahydromethanopterin reductase-like flavin-dependent oxidoreductase (luciferase family)